MEAAGIRAAAWVVGKALSPLSGGVLESWAASNKLGSNIEALKMELSRAQAVLNIAGGREIHNPALAGMLDKLRELAYGADDVLDELDYFRIQDELDGTYHAADEHPAGCVRNLAHNASHTAKACVNKLKCSRAASREDPDMSGKQGCLSGLRFCGGQREIGSSSRSTANKVGKHFSCFSWSPSANHDAQTNMTPNDPSQTPKLTFDRVEISRKISDVTERLKPVCANVHDILSLEPQNSSGFATQNIAISRPMSTPLIIEPKLYGRDNHKKIIVEEIVNSECRGLTVLPIVGPGGIGKTTFIQHIYEQMKSQFHVPIWICVSLDFNVNRLVKDIAEKIPQVNNENTNCSHEELIEQRLKGKRVLLILDDVWPHHEDEWKKVITLFKKEGAQGNMVIVTTRIPEIADTIKTTKRSLELNRLCPEDTMSFFEECVFGNLNPWGDHPELSEIGSEIVEKLKGSPLAARTVGRLLRNKLTLYHWRSILENKEWESQKNENDIMPALKLSYRYLPFHLQQCFSFCSLFPEDYEFGSEELIHLWIGLEILHSYDENKKRLQDVGLGYLDDLVNYGFFKMNKMENTRPYYVIHDLLHELAVEVSSYECLSIYSSNVRCIRIPPSLRHLSIIVDDKDVEDRASFEDYDANLSALFAKLKVENLHTLMLFGGHHGSFAKTFGGLFKEARALRAIFLSKLSYHLDHIFPNFYKLVHLRYLRITLSYYHYKCLSLPSALFRLYHLEVIDLQSVSCTVSSTRNMNSLVKLRHFLVPIDKLDLHFDIYGVGKLTCLLELREFRVGKESEGFELSQLEELKEIGGSLGIYNLEKVHAREEAHKLKLIHKNYIRQLILEWDVLRSNKDPVQEGNVLGNLVPHCSLQHLKIKGHGGINCPSWLCTNLSVKCLESLCLDGVSWKNLPPLGEIWMINELGEECQGCSISPPHFHNLKSLELSNISRLTKWVGNGECPLFSHLEVLIIRDCCELIELPFSHPTFCEARTDEKMAWFPKLQELVIVDCPKLGSVPPIPWRMGAPCSAEVVRAGSCFERLVYPKKYGSKLSLEVEGKDGPGDVLWSGLNLCNLRNLEELHMKKIPSLPLDDFSVLTSLKKIVIESAISVLPPLEGDCCHGMYRFPVEDLRIGMCNASGKELTMLLSFLPNLSKLNIDGCENIIGLGVAEDAETIRGVQEQQKKKVGEEEIITAAATEGLLLLPTQLQELTITSCSNLSLLPNPLHDDRTGAAGGLQRLRFLRVFYEYGCPEFFSSYSSSSCSFFPFPACLHFLNLNDVKHVETLQVLSNLKSLTALDLSIPADAASCKGLWSLLAHGHLTELSLLAGSGFFAGSDSSPQHAREFFSGSCKLFDLLTNTNTGVLAVPICTFLSSSLTKLELKFDPEVECLTKEQDEAFQLLTSLQELRFCNERKLQRLPSGLPKLINLKRLKIEFCWAIQSLPSLPSSLQELMILNCYAINSLPSLPSSLERLELRSCSAIKSLPKDGLPSSMLVLDVPGGNSFELIMECSKFKGTIPIVKTWPA